MESNSSNRLRLRIYVTPGAPSSERAIVYTRAICEQFFAGQYDLEVVDTAETAIKGDETISVTPTLVKIFPPPKTQISGDFSMTETMLLALRSRG